MAEMKSAQLHLLLLPLNSVFGVAPYTWLVALLRHVLLLLYFFSSRWGDGTGNYNEDNFWAPEYDEDYNEVL